MPIFLAAVVLLALVFFSRFWAAKPEVYAHDFLPAETNFYYEWSSKDSFDENVAKYNLFDATIGDEQLNKVATIVGPEFSQVEELIWFRVEGRTDDAYLLRFADLEREYLVTLAEKNEDWFFYVPAPDILFIGPDEAMAQMVSSFVISRFTVNHSRDGVNLYWQIDKAPEFLESLSSLLLPLASSRDSFVNFTDHSIDFWQPRNASTTKSKALKFNQAKIPSRFDLAFGFNASSTDGFDKFIASNVILPHFDNLPYQNLSNEELRTGFLSNAAIISSEDAWLLLSKEDWQSKAIDLIQNLQLNEVERVLPDGTLYTELVASQEPAVLRHDFAGQTYWQIDNLYGFSAAGNYYLSNQVEMIENIMTSEAVFSNLWSNCLKNDKEIGDFVDIKTDYLTDGLLKDYFIENNIVNLGLFSYQNYTVEGIKLCF
ncbi:hypothetical protein C0580_03625 [Candidatus Parcubacteria bacterium]|nr:MAG: hypothetical protein C0580_03625 [Candidatus Parcubacteria bacterium]